MSEGWTTAEARKQERWCEGRGYERGSPVCEGRATVTLPDGRQVCQRCARKVAPVAGRGQP